MNARSGGGTLTRRQILGVGAAAAGSAILAACGGGSSNSTPTVGATSTGGARVIDYDTDTRSGSGSAE